MKKILLTLSLSASVLLSASLTEGKRQFDAQNYKSAYATFIKVAQEGMIAKYNLAYMYETGKGVKRNLQKALDFYLLSANDGYAPAQYSIANAYLKGVGVKKDISKALYYFELAAKQKDTRAINALKAIKTALKKAKENQAYLTIRSNVNNDKVYLDGRYIGKTKIIVPVASNIPHHIEVKKEGYTTYKFEEQILKPKQKKTLRAVLKRK